MGLMNKIAALFAGKKNGRNKRPYDGPPVEVLRLSLPAEGRSKVGRLFHSSAGELSLPSGQLIACDPFVTAADAKPFSLELPTGRFPVRFTIWEKETDQRVAFATIVFRDVEPVTWEILTSGDQSISELNEGEIFGYGVDSGTGCFMDVTAQSSLKRLMDAKEDWFEDLSDEMDKTYRHTWSWLNKDFDEANLICFSSGVGDGFYASYVSRDGDGEICSVVTDFGICEA